MLLIIRKQDISPSELLASRDSYPDEYLWGYRPLMELLGSDNLDIHYVQMPRDQSYPKMLLYVLRDRVLGDLKIVPSLAQLLWSKRKEYEAIFVTANSAIFTTLILKFVGANFRVYPLLLGWTDYKFPQMRFWKRKLWVSILRKADRVLSLGIDEVQELQKTGVENVAFLPFGVDTNFWSPGNIEQGDDIFSIGIDPNRDFELLCNVVRDLPVILCTSTTFAKTVDLGLNVKVVQGTRLDVRRWFRSARLVVIPLKDTIRPSGQNCILQAMATGKAVVTTSTKGKWTEKLIDRENCVLVPPDDREALREAIYTLYQDPERINAIGLNARRTAIEHFSINKYTGALLSAIEMNRGN